MKVLTALKPATGAISPESPLIKMGVSDFTLVPLKGHRVVTQGISSQMIDPVSRYLGLGKGALAEYMDLDRGTASRLASKGSKLPFHAAEIMLRLVEIHDMAADVFASEEDASTWLRAPHPLLDGERPLDAARTSYGGQNVKNLLIAAKYGGAA